MGVIALMPCRVGAEIRMDERYGVLYVKNVEPPAAAVPSKPGRDRGN